MGSLSTAHPSWVWWALIRPTCDSSRTPPWLLSRVIVVPQVAPSTARAHLLSPGVASDRTREEGREGGREGGEPQQEH